MRHFPVKEPLPVGWHTAAQLHAWRENYEASDVIPGSIEQPDIAWKRCLCSDLKRAWVTAQVAHVGTITQTPLLREIEANPFDTGGLKLPICVWRWILHLAWLTSHPKQRALRDDFLQRVRKVADLLDQEHEDTLVVSHAGTMMYLRKELLRRGYTGPAFGVARHAQTYLFTRGS